MTATVCRSTSGARGLCWGRRRSCVRLVSKTAVWRWQARFMDEGVEDLLRDKTRPPGTPRLTEDVADRIVALT